jgi:peptidyl-prolyl cis-trans isomerase C
MTNHAPQAASGMLRALAAALMIGAATFVGPAFAEDAATPAAPSTAETPAAEAPAAETPSPAAESPAPEGDAAAPAAPQQPDPTAVVATVGNETVTEADLAFAANDLDEQIQQMPPEQRRAFLLSVMIDMKVMAQAAAADGLDQSDAYTRRMQYLRDRELRGAFFATKVAAAVTTDEVKAAYDEMVADFKPEPEVHARHILVPTKEEADQVEADLKAGKPFEVEAMAKTTDPSGKQNGGDLGYFTAEQMVKPFADAAFALEAGQVSDPVQSQFGWHVIKVEDKRMSAPPTIDQVAQQLSQQVLYAAYDKVLGDLKKATPVTIPDAALAAEVKAQNEPDSPAEATAEDGAAQDAAPEEAPAADAPPAAPAQ